MKTELKFAGSRITMHSQLRRRVLVVLIYAGSVALFAGSWYLDHWGISAMFAFVASVFLGRGFLGGFDYHGLVRPFNPEWMWMQSWRPVSETVVRECRSDERDIRFRDRAHFYSHNVLSIFALVTVLIAFSHWHWSQAAALNRLRFHFDLGNPHGLLGFVFVHAEILIYGLALAAAVLAQTLPQALIVWHEPEMESEQSAS